MLSIAARWGAAIVGAYLLASAVAAATAVFMPGSRLDAALAGTMLGLAVFAVAALWAFVARSALRAWIGMVAPAAVLGLAVWLQW